MDNWFNSNVCNVLFVLQTKEKIRYIKINVLTFD